MKRRDAIETKPTQLSKDSIVRAKTQNGPAFLFDLDGTSAEQTFSGKHVDDLPRHYGRLCGVEHHPACSEPQRDF